MAEYLLYIVEMPSGRLAIDGLPADRQERQSLTWRLLDTLRAVQHADSQGLSDGQAWQKYAKGAFIAGWLNGEDG